MSERENGVLDRRGFLSGASATFALGAICAPAVLHAVPALVPAAQTTALGCWGEWSIDDMWNNLPRATAQIGLGRRLGRCGVDVAAVDRQFCG